MILTNNRETKVYTPYKAGIPNLRDYLASMWDRRSFIYELSRAEERVDQMDTFFGRLWSVLSPLFMAGIYYLLVIVLSGGKQGPEFFLHLVTGVFIFNFISTAAVRSSKSITGSGRLIMNTAFPRALLPLTQTWIAFRQLMPSLIILCLFFQIFGLAWKIQMIYAIPGIALAFIFTAGLSMLTATSQVYIRDTRNLLPFVMRIAMYLSPVLYFPEQIKTLTDKPWLTSLNPVFAIIEVTSGSFARAESFPLQIWLVAIFWSIVSLVAGSLLLLSREGEFAVRI